MRSRAGLAGAALLLALTACGGGATEEPSGAAEPGSSSSEAPSAPTDPSPTAAPSGPGVPQPGVPLADGDVLELDLAQVRVPAGWGRDSLDHPELRSAMDPETKTFVSLEVYEDVAVSLEGEPDPLPEMARLTRKPLPKPNRIEVLDEVELDGQEFFHLSGPGPYEFTDAFGTSRDGRKVLLTFAFRPETSKRERERLIAAIAPTFAWR
jgi:hypothetical protein